VWCGLEELREVLRSFLARHCTDVHEVEDVIQETYLRAVRYRGKLKEGARLRSWTMRIAMNVLADRRRREKRYVPALEEELEPRVHESGPGSLASPLRIGRFDVESEDAIGLLHRALETLRDADRKLLESFYGGQESCRVTASECDLPLSLVKVRLFRARRRLCRAMRHRAALENGSPIRPGREPEASGRRSGKPQGLALNSAAAAVAVGVAT
jgi:RNA polymerase sigma-70 factor (ECF subfamily)